MPWFDMPLERLREYRTSTQEPDGLDDWWTKRLEHARAQVQPPVLTPYETDLYRPFGVFDVEFSGAGGDPIRAWYIKPGEKQDAPVVVKFIGYGGGRGVPSEHFLLPSLGYAILVMDTRGQGGRWTAGGTGDGSGSTGPENSQVMTRGIASPDDYYYTRLFTDAALAVDVALGLAGGGAKVAVTGASQGGGLALAAAALHGDAVSVCHADVPFLCDIQRAITFAPNPPYTEVPQFLAENVDTGRPGAEHPAVRRLRAARPPHHRDDAGQHGADGHHVPAVDGVRRLQRDNGGQGHHRVPVQRPQRAARPRRGTDQAPAQAPARLTFPRFPTGRTRPSGHSEPPNDTEWGPGRPAAYWRARRGRNLMKATMATATRIHGENRTWATKLRTMRATTARRTRAMIPAMVIGLRSLFGPPASGPFACLKPAAGGRSGRSG